MNSIEFFNKFPIIENYSYIRDQDETYEIVLDIDISIATYFMVDNFRSQPLPFFPKESTSYSISIVHENKNEFIPKETLKNFIKCENSELYMNDKNFLIPYSIAKMKSN